MEEKKLCLYCQTINPEVLTSCLACGAPLPVLSRINKTSKSTFINPSIEISKKPVKKTLVTAKKIGSDMDEVVDHAWSAYGLFWRTLGEVLTIAIISFGLGIIGGVIELPIWGVLTGIIFGILVGMIIKSYLWLIIGAPIGFVLGSLAGILILALVGEVKIILFVVFAFSCISVLIGAHFRKTQHKGFYEKIRPILGGLGGLLFSVLGMGIGLGFSAFIGQFY